MRALDRKLLRDLRRMRAQAVAIALVLASGVSLFIAAAMTYRSLRLSERQYYSDQRFGQIWSGLSRAPLSVARALEAVPGVNALDARIVQQVVLDVPNLDQPASGLLVSIPARADHRVNDLYLRRGRHVEPGRPDEVLVSEGFAETNRLALGDRIGAVVAGQLVSLRVVGVALSPEHVMPIPPGGLTPDDRRFGVLWMAGDQVAALVDLRGGFNEVAATLANGTDEGAVIAAFDRILAPYGGRGAFGRSSHPSHRMIEEHIDQLRAMAVLVPTIFLLAAAFLVNVVLSRVIATQREQIGMLKAFGYGSARVALHYLQLTLLVVFAGIAAGVPMGAWMGRTMTTFYGSLFRFPEVVMTLEPGVVALAALIAIVAVTAGTLGTLRRVVGMPPIVAMSAEIPAFGRRMLDRPGLPRLIAPASRMVLRNLSRRPLRTGLSVAGMSLAIAVVVLGGSSADAVGRIIDIRFQRSQREDLAVSLAHPRAVGTIKDFLSLPGVIRGEPFRAVPVRLLAAGRTQDLALLGLPRKGVLRRVVGNDYRERSLPPDGVVVTRWLAQQFSLHPGDLLTFEVRENRRRTVMARLADVVEEPLGVAAYMDLPALGRLLGEPETYSGATLTVDPAHERTLYQVLKRTPAALAVSSRRGGLANFRAMSDRMVAFIRQIEIVFSVIVAFGVVYNSARIALAERGRELATLRVLGFTRGEVSRILLGEVGALAAPGIPLGLALGYWLSGALVAALNGERMHFPHIVALPTYAFAVAVFLVAATCSALVVRRGLDRLDLLAVLKAKE
jgi:putative ABC transport system permease protein